MRGNGYDNFTMIPQVAFQFFTSMMVPKNSPFQTHFNSIINTVMENGLVFRNHDKAVFESELNLIKESKNGYLKPKRIKIISMKDLEETFVLYFQMNMIAVGALLLEVMTQYLKRKYGGSRWIKIVKKKFRKLMKNRKKFVTEIR